MALQKIYTDGSNNIVLPEAYHKADNEQRNIAEGRISFSVFIYKDEETRRATTESGRSRYVCYKIIPYEITGDLYDEYFNEDVLKEEGKTTLTQIYEYLKNEVEYYSDAEDV